MRTGSRIAAATAVAVVVLAGVGAWRARAAPEKVDRFPGQDENAANDEPARLAWRQFARVNAPAATASAGAAPPAANWELWASAEEVFVDPNRVPVWPSSSDSAKPQAAPPARRFERGLVQQRLFREQLGGPAAAPLALPSHPEAEAGEVRFNRTAFDWIVLKQLWYLEGQQKA